ncbi:MAG: AraC family transcriptional regulator [Bacteroidota bacterium]
MQPPFYPDALDQALRLLQPRGAFYFRSVLTAPWGALVPPGPASLHYIAQGGLWVEIDGLAEPVRLEAGDFVVLPHGRACTLRDAPTSAAVPFEHVLQRYGTSGLGGDGAAPAAHTPQPLIHKPGAGPVTEMICVGFAFEDAVPHPLIQALPPVIHLRDAAQQGTPWLTTTLDFLACEAWSQRPGAESVMGYLAGILFIQAVRAHFDHHAEASTLSGWLRGLRDRHLGPVLQAIPHHPETAWTVPAMAAQTGLSRSAFAARFRDVVGEPPMRHVTRWRIYRAAQLLRHEPLTLAEVAARVGYANEAAFSRTFKRWTGQAPGAFRTEKVT